MSKRTITMASVLGGATASAKAMPARHLAHAQPAPRRVRRIVSSVLAATMVTAATAVLPPRPVVAAPADDVGRYIVVLRDNAGDPRAVAEEHARVHRARIRAVHRFALKGYTADMSDVEARRLANDQRVRFVEPDQPVRGFGQTTPTGVDRTALPVEAGRVGTKLTIDGIDDRRVDAGIAILDTGVNRAHPDLNVTQTTDCTNGCIENSGTDGNGHGTHVAGIAAALDNGVGVVGVAPGARVSSVKVLADDGSGFISWIVAGIDWVSARTSQIQVANLSLGCRCLSSALDTAISNSVAAGITYTVAAGNSSLDASEFTPARHPDVIAVSALADFDGASGGLASPTCYSDGDDTLASFSNFGAVVDLAAPGTCITATWNDGGYRMLSGTSMASPHVAGAAAVLASQPAYRGRPAEIRDALLAAGNRSWTDDSGDSVQEPLLDLTRFSPVTVAGSVPPTISVNNPTVVEGPAGAGSKATFTLSLSAAPADGKSVSVKAATANGSAVAGSDYTALATTITFAAGETTKTVAVAVTGDDLAEGNETFVLNLSAPTGGVIADAQGLATVLDEEGLPAISVNNPSVLEGPPGSSSTANFTVLLSAAPPPGKSVSVRAATANSSAVAGSDYTALGPTTVTFAAGETTKAIPVGVTGDALAEGNETFVLDLTSPVGGVIADGRGLATIVNDDLTPGPTPPPSISVDNPSAVEGPPGATSTAAFTVSLSSAPAPGQTVSVRAATANGSAVAGSDYTALATTVSFAAGESTKTVAVPVTGDDLAEGNETFVLNLSAPTGAVIADTQGLATVLDEEGPPTLSVDNVMVVEGPPEVTSTAAFTVSLSSAPLPGQTISVRVATANSSAVAGSDYTALPTTTLAFAAGERTKTVSVTITGDYVVEGNEAFVLNLSSPTGAVLADSQGLATIVNDD